MARDTNYQKCITIPSLLTTIITVKSTQHVNVNRDSNSQFLSVFTEISFSLKITPLFLHEPTEVIQSALVSAVHGAPSSSANNWAR